jgi:hypothetical protein
VKHLKNNICRCGHESDRHRTVEGRHLKSYCRGCFDIHGGNEENWHVFILDNLKYLEQLYEEKSHKS